MAAEDVMFNSLLLLGFDCESMEKKHRIPFNKEMFSHRQGNLKGMEVVIYFLLHRLNPEETERTFRTCWPALEALQHREFKQLAYTVLQQMEKDGILPPNTLPGKSVLDTAFGERFYNLLFHLSTHALREILKQEFPAAKIPNLQRSLSQTVSVGKDQLKASLQAAKVHYCREMDRFKKFSQLVVSAQSRWRQFADDLTHRYRQLSHKLHKCVQEQEQFYSTVDKSIFTNMAALDRHAQLSAVRKMWKLLSEEYESSSTAAHGEAIVNDILNRGAPRHRLDIDTLLSHIPDSKQRANELSVYSNSTLDINTLTDRWHETLRTVHNGFLAESSRGHRVSAMHTLLGNVKSACSSHSAQLATLRNMNAQIKELLPQLEASVSVLESSLSEKKASSASSSSTSLSALTPFTHKVRSTASSLRTRLSATPSVVPTAGLKSYNLTLVPPTPVGPQTALGGALSMTPFTTVKGRNTKTHTNTTANNRYEKISSQTVHGVSASLPTEAMNRIQESIRRAVHDPVRHSVTNPLSPAEQDIKRRIEFNVDSGEKERAAVRHTHQTLLQSPEEKENSPKWISASPINAHDKAVDKFVDQFLDPTVDHSNRYSDENLYDPTFDDDVDSYSNRYSDDQVDTKVEPTSHSPHVRFAETVTNGLLDTNLDRSGHARTTHDLEDIDPQFDAHRHEFYKDEAAGFGRKRELLRTPSRPPLLTAHTTDMDARTGSPTRHMQTQQAIHNTPNDEVVYSSSFSLSVSPLVSATSPVNPRSSSMSASPLLSTISSSPLFTIEGHTSRSSKVKIQNYMEDVT
eukprot:GILK01012564.1.p1 GENE.GILK01012564.1~~GILK01012564.1.p1  ORF type:complete len:814 (-),score=144.86 GILK01012564.1:37-2439(-)